MTSGLLVVALEFSHFVRAGESCCKIFDCYGVAIVEMYKESDCIEVVQAKRGGEHTGAV